MIARFDPEISVDLQVGDQFTSGHYDTLAAWLGEETGHGNSWLYEELQLAARDKGKPSVYPATVNQLFDDLSGQIAHDVEAGTQPRDLCPRVAALCFCQLIRASLISATASMPASLVVAAVDAGYNGRDWKWGLQEAEKFSGDLEKQVRTEIDLLEYIDDDGERLDRQRWIINHLAGDLPGEGQYDLTDLIAPVLSAGHRDDLVQEIRSSFHDDYRGNHARSLAAIAPLFPEPARSDLLDEALRLAREHENTRAHALTILLVLPHVPRSRRQGLWREFLHAVAEGALGLDNWWEWRELTQLAEVDELGPQHFLRMVDAATTQHTDKSDKPWLSVRQRDELIVDYACSLAERKRFGAAYEAYRAISADDARLAAQVRALDLIEPRWLSVLGRLPDPLPPFRRLMWRMFGSGPRKLAKSELGKLHEDLLDRVLELDDDHLQDNLLADLYPHLTGTCSRQVLDILRSNADSESERAERASRLANLAILSPRDSASLLEAAFALTSIADEPGQASVLAACDHALNPPEPPVPTVEGLQDLVDLEPADAIPALESLLGQVPEALIPAAWEAVWSAGSPARLMALLAARMAELGQLELACGRLRPLITSLETRELARFLENLPVSLTTVRTYQYVLDRWEQSEDHPEHEPGFSLDLKAIRAVSGRLPAGVVALITEWCRAFRPAGTWSGPFRDEILANLVPLYAQVAYLAEAQEMAASITAHQPKARALADLAPYLPDPGRASMARQAQALMSVDDADRVWPEYVVQFVESRAFGTGWQHISEVVKPDLDARTWAMIAVSLPPGEAEPAWAKAIEEITGDEIVDLVDRMPETVTSKALERIARISADELAEDSTSLLPLLFSRIRERGPLQQVKCLTGYLKASAALGRPALLRSMRELVPVLRELGGDAVLPQLQASVEKVGRWWP